jgi:hypothetical protein
VTVVIANRSDAARVADRRRGAIDGDAVDAQNVA